METAEDKAKRVTASDEVFLTSHEWRELVRALLPKLKTAERCACCLCLLRWRWRWSWRWREVQDNRTCCAPTLVRHCAYCGEVVLRSPCPCKPPTLEAARLADGISEYESWENK